MAKQMIDGSAGPARKDIGTLLIASLFIGLGLVTLYDVTTYSDTDSVVFPTFVAYALIFCSVLVILYSWLRPSRDNGFGSGDWWRRLLLVATMLIACLIMPFSGFLPATAVAFVGGSDRRAPRGMGCPKRDCLCRLRHIHHGWLLRPVPLCAGCAAALAGAVGFTSHICASRVLP
jgi:hypothetical protein